MSAPMQLKPRQIEAFDAVFAAMEKGIDRQLIQLPTGVGKTCVAVHIAKKFDRVLFLVHRQELVEQTRSTVERIEPDRSVGYLVQGIHDLQSFTIGMIPTVYNRLDRIDPNAFDLVVIDECHRSMAKTWRLVADHFNPKLRIGLSATPERTDGSDLSCLFSEITYAMSVGEAIRESYLVPLKARQCLTSCSLSGVRTVGGDLNEGDLQAVIDVPERNAFVVEKYQEHAPGRRAICFAVSIAHAQHITEAFTAAGIAADYVAGDSPDRAEKLARFASGAIQVLSSCMVLCEGFDSPIVDCILLARPTKSRPLFAQMIGRGLRLFPGKEDCIVLDFTDNAGRHLLASAWRFLGYTKQPADDEVLSVDGEKKKRESKVAAIDLEREINLLLPPPELPTYAGKWQYEPATTPQLEYLARLGYDVIEGDYSKGQAASLIANAPVSAFQVSQLKELGYDVNQSWNRGQYSRAMDAAKETGASALLKMRRAGFKVAVISKKLSINPVERLDMVQLAWVDKHKPALMLALKEEKKIELKIAA